MLRVPLSFVSSTERLSVVIVVVVVAIDRFDENAEPSVSIVSGINRIHVSLRFRVYLSTTYGIVPSASNEDRHAQHTNTRTSYMCIVCVYIRRFLLYVTSG